MGIGIIAIIVGITVAFSQPIGWTYTSLAPWGFSATSLSATSDG